MFYEPPPSRAPYVIAGAIAVVAGIGLVFFSREDSDAVRVETKAATPSGPLTLEKAREYFETWGGYLIWEHDYTEFALWSPDTGDYTEFFGVRISDGEYRIQKLKQLTRPLIDHGEPAVAPMAFTEPAAQRTEFYRRNPQIQPRAPAWRAASTTVPKLPPKPPRALTPSRFPASTLDARELIGRFEAVVKRGNLPGVQGKTEDLIALLKLNGVEPLAPNAGVAAIDRAVLQRSNALQGVLPMALALLDEAQLRALQAAFEEEIAELKQRRATAR